MSNPFDNQPQPVALTVSQLNRQVKSLLESHFGFIWVEGEISNFACPSSGHWYFSLKDGDAQVRCAMFRGRNQRVRQRPGNGDAVRIRARVSLYEGRGEFQLIVEHLEPAGAGALQAAFDKLKAKLLAEGLFDSERKHPLPLQVSHLGIVTSPTGAAIHDILTVLKRRCPGIRVSVLPVAVQGQNAAPEIAATIERANRWQREGAVSFDALIVGRGGGSLEDLWAFNEEIVARAIAASELPVVSAVGHEIDFSIADMVADHRAATPSAAAELLSPDQQEWQAQLAAQAQLLQRLVRRQLADRALQLTHLRQRLKHPGATLREKAQRLDELEQRLKRAGQQRMIERSNALALLRQRLMAQHPGHVLTGIERDSEQLQARLVRAMQQKLQSSKEGVQHMAQVLDSLSPLRTLDRGYAIVTDASGEVVRSTRDVNSGDRVAARLAEGSLQLLVEEVREGD